MSERLRPQLWSDFDGTAVKRHRWTDLRNWSKYPLHGIAGYGDFLRGVQIGNVDIAGIVTSRPDILPRRIATARSVAKLGLDSFFWHPGQTVLVGSDSRKGAFVANQSENSTVGLIEDKPHRVGPAILEALLEVEPAVRLPIKSDERRIVSLGVVSHPKSQEYTARFIDSVRDRSGDTGIDVVERFNDHTFFLHGPNSGFRMSVVQLAPYSEYAGQLFANHLNDFAPPK